MSYIPKFVAAVLGLLALAIIAAWQMFLFAMLRDPLGLLDSQGGRNHLWLALSAGFAACVAGALMFYFFLHRERNKWPNLSTATIEPPLTAGADSPTNSLPGVPFNRVRWMRQNSWLSEGQADDRIPMNGSVAASSGTPSAQRAFARRSHQLRFKSWSQARHD